MIAPTPFFADRGCHVRIYEEIKALQQIGHEIILCTYGLGRNMPGIKTVRCFNFPWYRKLTAGPSYTKILLLPFLIFTTIITAVKFNPEIIHAFLPEGAIIAKISKIFFPKKKYFYDMQGSLVSECLEHKFIKPGGLRFKTMVWLERKISLWFFVITQSKNLVKHLKSLGVPVGKIVNVKDGVDTDIFRPLEYDENLANQLGVVKNKPRIIYMGLLEKYQGVDLMFEAFVAVAKQKRKTQFIVIGYPNIEKYQQMCRDLGIEDQVKFLGKIDYSLLPKYLALASISVAPKISQSEGDGKLYNYMSAGLAIVVFDRSVSREILGNAGVYAEFGSASDLAKKIVWLIDHSAEAKQLGQKARQRAISKLSWRAVGKRINQVYLNN